LSDCAGAPLTNLGVANGQLTSCPTSPNCVNSQAIADDEGHFISPVVYAVARQKVFATLIQVIKSLECTNIITTKDSYLRIEFSSAVIGLLMMWNFIIWKSL